MTTKPKLLICGATGFIGRNLVEQLAPTGEWEITAVAHQRPAFPCPDVQWVTADLRDAPRVDELLAGVDVVVQAAATTSGAKDIATRPYIHVTDNAVMNSLLLRAAYDHGVKHFIFFSCTVMYPSLDAPVREEDFTGEILPRYFAAGWTKVYIERMAEFYAGLGRTRHTVVRHSNIYGPHDKFDLERSHVFGATVTKVMTTADRLMIWGNGKEQRDLLHVDDLVRYVRCALAQQTSPYCLHNVGSGRAITVRALCEKIVTASGRNLAIEHDLSKPSIPFNLTLDCSKAREAFGWQPRIRLEEGIARTIDWWRDHIDPATLRRRSA